MILSRVAETKDQGLLFRYKPVEAIKAYLMKHTHVMQFPSKNNHYGGLVSYRNGRYFIHINTGQPKTYENFMWVHEYYHFKYEADMIKNSNIRTFYDDTTMNENERCANLFAAELLMDGLLVKDQFALINELYVDETLESRVIRLIPVFQLPYKAIVVKLAQDGLITLDEAQAIIDYPYRNHLPADFDQSILRPSMAIQIDNLKSLLNSEVVKSKMLDNDLRSFQEVFEHHFNELEALRERY